MLVVNARFYSPERKAPEIDLPFVHLNINQGEAMLKKTEDPGRSGRQISRKGTHSSLLLSSIFCCLNFFSPCAFPSEKFIDEV